MRKVTDHRERARKAWPILALTALENKEPLTYGQLCHLDSFHNALIPYISKQN